MGSGWELDAIAAIVIGGARLFGGEGNIIKAMVGVLIYQMIANIMNLVSLSPFYQSIVKALVIISVVGVSVVRARWAQRGRTIEHGERIAHQARSAAGSRRFWHDNGTLVVLALFVAMAALVSQGVFLRPSNLITVLYQASIIGILVLGQAVVVIGGGLDLSMVAVLILSAVVMGGAGSQQQAMMTLGGLPYLGFWPALFCRLRRCLADRVR